MNPLDFSEHLVHILLPALVGSLFFVDSSISLSFSDYFFILCLGSFFLHINESCLNKKNFLKKPTKEQETTEYEFGETSFSHTFPFLGKLTTTSTTTDPSLQVLENNMYRSAIFKHKIPLTDFLLVRTRFGFFLRHFPNLFVVGQEMPLIEVPSPNSKRAKDFGKDFMMSCIYRLFWENDKKPRRVRMDELRRIFPNQDAIIRKNLKQIAEFKRVGVGLEFWVFF